MGEANRRGTFEERRALSPGMQHQVLLVAENGSELREPVAVLQETFDPRTGARTQIPFRGSREDAEGIADDLRRVNPRGVYKVKAPEKLRHIKSAKIAGAYRAPSAIRERSLPRLRAPVSQHKEIISYMKVASFLAVGNQGRRLRQAKEQGRLDRLTIKDLQNLTHMEAALPDPRPQRAWLALWKFQNGVTRKTDVHTPKSQKTATPYSRPDAHDRRKAAHIAANPLRAARAERKTAVGRAIVAWATAIVQLGPTVQAV